MRKEVVESAAQDELSPLNQITALVLVQRRQIRRVADVNLFARIARVVLLGLRGRRARIDIMNVLAVHLVFAVLALAAARLLRSGSLVLADVVRRRHGAGGPFVVAREAEIFLCILDLVALGVDALVLALLFRALLLGIVWYILIHGVRVLVLFWWLAIALRADVGPRTHHAFTPGMVRRGIEDCASAVGFIAAHLFTFWVIVDGLSMAL